MHLPEMLPKSVFLRALFELVPNPKIHFKENVESYEMLEWLDERGQPTEQDLTAKMDEIQAADDAIAYKEKRKAEYPPIGDQLDSLFHAGLFPEDMAAKLQAIKDKYPKE